MKKIHFLLYTAILLAATTDVKAQQYQSNIEKFKSRAVTWDLRNAALLKTIPLPDAGEAQLGYFYDNGSFKHPFDAASSSGVHFNATRAHNLKGWSFYGAFDLKSFKDKDVPKTAMANPFRDNPYQLADSLSGDWNKQHYLLNLKVAAPSLMNGKLVTGLGLEYEVLTGARQKDPRPLDNSSQITMSPALVYHLNKNQFLGLNGTYRHYKEDLDVELYNYRMVYNLYKLQGLAEYKSSAPLQMGAEGAGRMYAANEGGGDIQYGYKTSDWNLLLSAGYRYHNENATDGSQYPQKAGQHEYHEYTAAAFFDITTKNKFHQLAFNWQQKDISNREFHQVQNTDSKQYETIYSSVFNTALKTRSYLMYLLNGLKGGDSLSWTLKAGAGFTGLDNRYTSPRSWQTVDKADLSLSYTKYFQLNKGAAFSFSINSVYEFIIKERADYTRKSYSSDYVADNIFYPVHSYLSTPSWTNQLSAQYNLPRFSDSRSQLYFKVAGYVNTAMASYNRIQKNDTRQGIQLSVGLYN